MDLQRCVCAHESVNTCLCVCVCVSWGMCPLPTIGVLLPFFFFFFIFLVVMASRGNQESLMSLFFFLMVCAPQAKIEQSRPGLRLPMKIQ